MKTRGFISRLLLVLLWACSGSDKASDAGADVIFFDTPDFPLSDGSLSSDSDTPSTSCSNYTELSSNLLTNSGFEAEAANWTVWEKNTASGSAIADLSASVGMPYYSAPFDGSYYAHMRLAGDGYLTGFYQSISLPENTVALRFEGRRIVKTEDTSGSHNVTVRTQLSAAIQDNTDENSMELDFISQLSPTPVTMVGANEAYDWYFFTGPLVELPDFWKNMPPETIYFRIIAEAGAAVATTGTTDFQLDYLYLRAFSCAD
ncbi:MAG: hypothetical protein IPJ88_02560 [Myxococcales bacterium]|nr:MAG: hypothetical protein IPJ88_02560 [Myxococcales bacterium]